MGFRQTSAARVLVIVVSGNRSWVVMKFVLALLLAAAAVTQCKVIGSYDSEGGSNDAYESMSAGGGYESSSSSSGYESGGDDYETTCTPYFETVHIERCEHYEDKVCYTSQQESCDDVVGENCRAIISSRQVRQCHNVTELLCGLKETIQYDIVQAVFTVQKCHQVTERVCDTVYEPQMAAKDDFQCIVLSSPKCYAEDRTVIDKTCRTTTSFDCGHAAAAAVANDHHASGGHHGGDSYGHLHGGDSYGSSSGSDYRTGNGYGHGGDDYGSSSGYHEEEAKCKRSQDTKCYTTPRTVTSQKCEVREEKVCEKLSEKVPFPAEKQVCHDEDKKVCELEQRQQPKQIKKYVYTKQCRSVPRRVCENADVKELVPSCVPSMRKQCHYTPVEKCEHVPEQFCYKVPKKIQKQKCETVKKPASPSYGDDMADNSYSKSDYSS